MGFLFLAIALTTLDAWMRHMYFISVLFGIFGVVFFYKLLTGKILSSSLR
jgi:hypothetical protein